jgi:hypothetical protein
MGAPQVRRLKTYSAESGRVYQYYYEGHRPSTGKGTEYVFAVSADRRTYFPVSVFLAAAALSDWQHKHARGLTATEQYAVAKMALFQAFDERAGPREMRRRINAGSGEVEIITKTLGLV